MATYFTPEITNSNFTEFSTAASFELNNILLYSEITDVLLVGSESTFMWDVSCFIALNTDDAAKICIDPLSERAGSVGQGFEILVDTPDPEQSTYWHIQFSVILPITVSTLQVISDDLLAGPTSGDLAGKRGAKSISSKATKPGLDL